MTVGRIGSTTGAMEAPPRQPREITKRGLEEMRDRMTKDGGEVPQGLDTLIEKFDEAAGSDGKMMFAEFKAFAKENGVTVADAPKGSQQPAGRKAGEAPGAGGGGARAGQASGSASGASGTTAESSSASEDLSGVSDSQLKMRAAKGDSQAIKELSRREAQRAAANGSPSPSVSEDPVGQNVDEYA
jgi:hypothetical protein